MWLRIDDRVREDLANGRPPQVRDVVDSAGLSDDVGLRWRARHRLLHIDDLLGLEERTIFDRRVGDELAVARELRTTDQAHTARRDRSGHAGEVGEVNDKLRRELVGRPASEASEVRKS